MGVLLEAGASAGGMTSIVSSVTTLVTMIGTVFTAMINNEFLTYCLASAALGIAISKFRALRRAA